MRSLSSLAVASLAAAALIVPAASQANVGHGVGQPQAQPYRFFNSAQPISLFRHYMPTRERARALPNACCMLNYYGGPVLNVPHAYVIFWGFGKAKAWKHKDPSHLSKILTELYLNYGGSGMGNVATQYYSGSTTKTYISNEAGQGKFWRDNVNPIPAHPTDSQIQAEAWKGVAHFGYDPMGAYIVQSAYQHDPSGYISQGWCAYHGASQQGNQIISYTNEPYQPDGGSSCGANIIGAPGDEPGAAEGATIVINHEYTESVTDPQPTSGWYSPQGGEIGDLCAWQNIQNDPFGTFSFTMQPEYSNASLSCVHSYP